MKRESEQPRHKEIILKTDYTYFKKIKAREKDNHEIVKEHRVKRTTYPYLGKNRNGDLPADYHTDTSIGY